MTCIYALLTDTQITDRAVIRCDDDYSILSEHFTLYETGKILDGKNLVGIQIEDIIAPLIIGMTDAEDIDGAIQELVDMGSFTSYVCRQDEPEVLLEKYPELSGTRIEVIDGVETEIKNFSGWAGVMKNGNIGNS